MRKLLRILTLTPLILIAFIPYHPSFAQALVHGDCHQFRTQTQGGWGSPASGNNPGAYRDAHFDGAFPNGLEIGCAYTLALGSAQAVEAFLPSGGPASVLSENLTDPSGYANVLAGQLVTLTLSVGFDSYDPNFSPSQTHLSDQIISAGAFAGFSVAAVIEEANRAIGGCHSKYSLSEINKALTAINENYVDGTSNGGFLDCPELEQDCAIEVVALKAHCTDGSNYEVELVLSGTDGGFEVIAPNAVAISGNPFCVGQGQTAEVVLVFEQGSDYSFSVVPAVSAGCAPGL